MPTSTPSRRAGDEPLPNRGDTDRTFSDLREDVFATVVEENPNVCSRCFFRHRAREERPNTAGNEKRARKSSFLEYEVPERPMMNELDWRYYETETLTDRTGYEYVPDELGGGKTYEPLGYSLASVPDEIEAKVLEAGEYPSVEGGKHRYCRNCGVVGTNSSEPRRTRYVAVRAAFTLSQTLKEYEIPHDPRHLVESVRGMKGVDSLSGDDPTIFEIATETAVELAERELTESAWKPTHDRN